MTPILPGDKFGRLTVVEATGERRHGQIVWRCQCECGRVIAVVSHSLRHGLSRSCGCISVERNIAQRIDLTGQRFGRLVVVAHAGGYQWRCTCDCGRQVVVCRQNLRSGKTQSCGCIRTERVGAMAQDRADGRTVLAAMAYDGTNIAAIKPGRRLNRNSTTGVRGVNARGNRYRAVIALRGEQYRLGMFNTIDEAKKAREEAEEKLFQPIIEAWGRDQ